MSESEEQKRARESKERADRMSDYWAEINACNMCDAKGYRGIRPCPHEESSPMPDGLIRTVRRLRLAGEGPMS